MNSPMYSISILTFKMNVKDVDDLRTYLVNMHMCAKIGTSRSSRLFVVHNGTFREGRADGRTNTRKYAHTAWSDNTVQQRRNGVNFEI